MPEPVCIGVAVRDEPEQLTGTLRMLHAHTPSPYRVVLLPDGPDPLLAAALATDPQLLALDRWIDPDRVGMAATFNRLASRSRADVLVLLESGALVGPRWLDLLIAALRRPGCGVAGPSTNRAWNEQAIAPNARGDDASVRRDAAGALRRFGHATRTLEPLYSLSAFCYAVRREVVDAIGPADEGYGRGPCWEMDYNVRAARAGFRGVWVGASYVYRTPPSPRRVAEEAARLDASRRRYQDRFCGLLLTGASTEYREHCLGDDCPHFAPVDVAAGVHGPPTDGRTTLAVRTPGERVRPPVRRRGERHVGGPARAESRTPELPINHPEPPSTVTRPPGTSSASPLVSAIMPTRGRPDFALQAVRYFQRQDYPNRELVIVEDGPAMLAGLLPDDPRIRLVANTGSLSIGALRNLACQHARGELVVQWDDDDWHGPTRISRQTDALRHGEADITALRDALVFDLGSWLFWRLSAEMHRRMFVRDVHGGTLAFRRSVWEGQARYPDRSLAEDAAFLDQAVRRGARLHSMAADGLFLYVRHDSNSWRLEATERPGWSRIPEPSLPTEDRDYYRLHSRASPPPTTPDQPLVSCIMPTDNRREFIPRAINYFRRQDYAHKELVIIDDGSDCVADLIPDDPRIVYRRLERRMILGAKRNLACELARGSIIVHCDDDDWQAPHRFSAQVARLRESGSDVCGARSVPFYDPSTTRAWRYDWPHSGRIWAAGSSLCYRKALWMRSPFPEVATGEDSRFVWSKAVRTMCDISEKNTLVSIIHRRNTVPKSVHGAHWTRVSTGEIESLLGADLELYRRPL